MDFQNDSVPKTCQNQIKMNTFNTISSASVSKLLADELCATIIFLLINVKNEKWKLIRSSYYSKSFITDLKITVKHWISIH